MCSMCSWNLSAHSIKRSVSEAKATFRITFTMSRPALITEVRSAACAIVVACSWCLKSRTACRSVTTACSISWVGELPSVCSCTNFLVYSFIYLTTLSHLYRRMNLNHQLGRISGWKWSWNVLWLSYHIHRWPENHHKKPEPGNEVRISKTWSRNANQPRNYNIWFRTILLYPIY